LLPFIVPEHPFGICEAIVTKETVSIALWKDKDRIADRDPRDRIGKRLLKYARMLTRDLIPIGLLFSTRDY
jgi:hypothetical protein